MVHVLEVAEIGTAGVAGAFAAFHLGLYRIDLLMMVFFSVVLAGQMVAAMLARTLSSNEAPPRE
jgi:hypothetical protein